MLSSLLQAGFAFFRLYLSLLFVTFDICFEQGRLEQYFEHENAAHF